MKKNTKTQKQNGTKKRNKNGEHLVYEMKKISQINNFEQIKVHTCLTEGFRMSLPVRAQERVFEPGRWQYQQP